VIRAPTAGPSRLLRSACCRKYSKRKEWIAHAAFGPVEKDAALGRNQNISRIEIDMPQCVWEMEAFEQLAGFRKTFPQEASSDLARGAGDGFSCAAMNSSIAQEKDRSVQ